MLDTKIFWIAGTPRTGSMLTVNIIREILKVNGFNIEPKEQYQADQQYNELFKSKAINNENPLTKYVF